MIARRGTMAEKWPIRHILTESQGEGASAPEIADWKPTLAAAVRLSC